MLRCSGLAYSVMLWCIFIVLSSSSKYNYEDKCFGIFSTTQPVLFFTRKVILFFNYKSIPERLVHCGCPLRPSGHQWAAVFVGLWIKGAVRWQIQSQRLGTGWLPAERVNALGKSACEINICKC